MPAIVKFTLMKRDDDTECLTLTQKGQNCTGRVDRNVQLHLIAGANTSGTATVTAPNGVFTDGPTFVLTRGAPTNTSIVEGQINERDGGCDFTRPAEARHRISVEFVTEPERCGNLGDPDMEIEC